jgi:hypothetical protein
MKTWTNIKLGIAGVSLAGFLWLLNDRAETYRNLNEVQNLNAIVRYHQIENELNKPIKVVDAITKPEDMKRYNQLKEEKDSLESISDFMIQKQKYDRLTDSLINYDALYTLLGIPLAISGGLLVGDLMNFYKRKKSKKQ